MISIEETKMIAGICKLRFNDDELSHMAKQLSSVMQMMQKLEQINCNNIEPTSIFSATTASRPDEIEQTLTVDELFMNAPDPSAATAKQVHYFIVPKVIE